jgi:hypothetical protein
VIGRESLGYGARAHAWLPLAAAAAVAVILIVVRQGEGGAVPLQVSAILLASGAGYALDDAALELLGPSPTSLLRRRLQRLTLVLPLTTLTWSVLCAWHGTAGAQETGALVAMFLGLVGLSLGAAAVAVRRSSRGRGGSAVGPTLFALIVLSTIVPPRWRPLPLGDVPGGWAAISMRWTAAALLGVVVFLVASRDPASRLRRP